MPAIGITLVIISLIIISPLLSLNVYIPSFLVYFLREAAFNSILIPTFHTLSNFGDKSISVFDDENFI